MVKRLITLASLILIALFLWLVDIWYPDIVLKKGVNTAVAITVIYFVFKLVLEERFIRKIKDAKRRYFFNKTSSIVYFIFLIFIILVIWVENLQALLVGFGLVAAGVTIALQEVAKNFVGGLLIFFNNIYGVGDRIEISSKMGDVIDIGIFNTTILETNEWVSGDQPTGRLTVVPNGLVLYNVVNNYTKDFNFIWDEMTLPITYDSDWRAAETLIMDVIKRETEQIRELAEKEIPNLEQKYFFSKRSTEPVIFLKLTDNWIELSSRYVTGVRQRRLIKNRISQQILEEIERSENIKIASQTFDIVALPEVRLKEGT